MGQLNTCDDHIFMFTCLDTADKLACDLPDIALCGLIWPPGLDTYESGMINEPQIYLRQLQTKQ